MKGYALLTTENQIVVKDKHYIDNYEPTFWNTNHRFLIRKWQFDTENLDSVKHIVIFLKGLGPQSMPDVKITNFIAQIGLTVEDLKKAP